MDIVELTGQAATTGLIAKAAVDIYRKSPIPSPSWALPLAALVVGIGGSFILGYIEEVVFTGPQIAQRALVGSLGAASAVAVTEVHEWVRKNEPRSDETLIDKAIDLAATKADPEVEP